MVDRNLIREFDVSDDDFSAAIGVLEEENINWLDGDDVNVNQIIDGTILRVDDEFVLIDVGYKSEGVVPRGEWEDEDSPPEIGQVVSVLIEDVESVSGPTDTRDMIVLSKLKAEKIKKWDAVMASIDEGDVVSGGVTRKIKGGLLVDIGVNVFLPASQVDIRRPSDIGEYIGKTIECMVLKIDETRRNIVVSRRSLIEAERAKKKAELLKELEIGQRRNGIVKNIADFGAFVDLGGIDGLLHITDMSWGRIGHPSEMVKIEDELEVVILNIDYEKEKIALGLKQKFESPWEKIEEKYPVNTRHKGKIVNVMSYGAFVKLEDGIEGLVHISEMSWTKRVSHPSDLVNIDDEVEVVVLGINKDKQEISLGMKQTQDNPWDNVADRHPIDSLIKGRVRNLTNYGAFVEIEEGIDGLLHVSDMSWTRKVGHPSEVVEKGQEIDCRVLSIDQQRRRIALGLKQLEEDPWSSDIPDRYQPGQLTKGKVTKLTNFGVFVRLEDGLEGLLHISELADHKVENPEEVVKMGEEIEVKILRVDCDDRKIGLSRKRVEWAEQAEAEEGQEAAATGVAAAAGVDLKGGIGSASGPLFSTGTPDSETPDSEAADKAVEEGTEVRADAVAKEVAEEASVEAPEEDAIEDLDDAAAVVADETAKEPASQTEESALADDSSESTGAESSGAESNDAESNDPEQVAVPAGTDDSTKSEN